MIFPKLVRFNHRYRGPYSSVNNNNFNKAVINAINELYDAQNNNIHKANDVINKNNNIMKIQLVDINKLEGKANDRYN